MPKKTLLIPLIIIPILAAGAYLVYLQLKGNDSGDQTTELSDAKKAGQNLSNGKCSGEGPGILTALPMNKDDFSIIIPYGLTAGGHVTPIDHQYYSPTVFNSPRDTYPVFAMADARLVDVQPRDTERGREYRMVFSMTCTFLYYYDLVTSLAPDVQTAYERGNMDLSVTAGQIIGRIGGQTLDFAVWDTTKPLTGFVRPESYAGEAWKIYTADPLEYVTKELKEKMLAKYIRVADPISGKIDHDIDGRLVGNWFLEGSGGYAGPGENQQGYWSGHLSIAPEHIDPTAFIVSFGDFNGEATQFSIPRNSLNPAEVSSATGLVKYELLSWNYQMGDGKFWDRSSFPVLPMELYNEGYPSQGCVLLQLIEDRKLKMEVFPGKTCSSVTGFTAQAQLYTR
ncbi:MAG TPA: hypothetical protein VI794_02405 [Patescibacteria group bacterium]|nr:hypothetical protein [Patescibacteria group bacterium]